MGNGQSSKEGSRDTAAISRDSNSGTESLPAERSATRVPENGRASCQTRHTTVSKGCQQVQSKVKGWCEDQNGHAKTEAYSVTKPSVDCILHKSAKAGLASNEDFTAVVLRKTTKAADGSAKLQVEVNGWRQPLPLLVQIKGRRHVQVQLVECAAKSLNEGDVFLLLTETELFQWIGQESNGFERAKSGDLASRVLRAKEMGCRTTSITVVEQHSAQKQTDIMLRFMKLLGGTSHYQVAVASAGKSDEEFELQCIESIVVYTVEEHQGKLVPLTERCARVLEHSMLTPTEVYVFDFFSEVFVWIGRLASFQLRQRGMKQAKDLFTTGYLERKSSKSVVHLATWIGSRRRSRPKWALFSKVTDGAEPFLFKEKFIDWPCTGNVCRPKQQESSMSKIADTVQLQPCNIDAMKIRPPSPPDFILSGENLGRGLGVLPSDDTLRSLVETTSLTVWNIKEFDYHTVPESDHGVFYSHEGYVVRWSYSLVGNDMKHRKCSSSVSQDHCCYFFWLGEKCSVTKKGATAMLTVELDNERGPQIRVCQGKEPPAFLQLFDGGMIVCTKQLYFQGRDNRMFWVGGEIPREAHLVEIPIPSALALRSQGCFVVTVSGRHEVFIWCGCKATENSCSIASFAAKRLIERLGLEENGDMQLLTVSEGQEDETFWKAVGGKRDYYNLLQEPKVETFTPRLFLLSQASGEFAAEEILSPSRMSDGICTFPFIQSDLYNAPQPALFLLDAQCCVYLWCLWSPAEDGRSSALTGEATNQQSQDQELAMKTAVDYAESIGEDCPAYMVVAGREPSQFKSLFPWWIDADLKFGTTNMCDQNELLLIQQQLQPLERQEKFHVEELRARPLPNGVDPVRLETYLTDTDFEVVFGMSREAFYRLPGWKQTRAKQVAGLY